MDQPAHNLPAQLTPFIGRTEELNELKSLLGNLNCRLLTLVGQGGSGKTRRAIEGGREGASCPYQGGPRSLLRALRLRSVSEHDTGGTSLQKD